MTAEEAIKQLKEYILGMNYMDDVAVWVAIKALEQQPKIGHWIMTSHYLTTAYGSVDYVECSCCGEDSLEEGDYCPNCGAKMIESENKE